MRLCFSSSGTPRPSLRIFAFFFGGSLTGLLLAAVGRTGGGGAARSGGGGHGWIDDDPAGAAVDEDAEVPVDIILFRSFRSSATFL